MMHLLTSSWFAVLAGGVVYLASTVVFLNPASLAESLARNRPLNTSANGGFSWEFFNPEVEQLVGELRREKEALATRAQQLNELAARLQAERSEINQVTQAVHQLQQDLDKLILRVRHEETPNLKKLAKVYSSMSPEGAAAILRQMDDDSAVKIFIFMKEAEAAVILENLARLGDAEAKRAVAMSERIKTAVYRNSSP